MDRSAEGLQAPGRGGADASHRAILRDGLFRTIERIGKIIDLETESLQHYRPIDLGTFNHQKSRDLLELTRAMRALPPGSFDAEILQKLAQLRAKLEKNLAVLNTHLKAVRQVSALIARAIEDDNSDGTYSAVVPRMGRSL